MKPAMGRILRIALLLSAPLLPAACGGPTSDKTDATTTEPPDAGPIATVPAVPPQQSTPQRLVVEFKQAVEAHDWEAVFDYMTEGSRELVLDDFVRSAEVMPAAGPESAAELKKVLAAHGVKAFEVLSPERYADVPDQALLCADVDGWAISDAIQRKQPVQTVNLAARFAAVSLDNFQIEGDRATAEWSRGKDNLGPARFVRIEGAWYVDLLHSFEPKPEKQTPAAKTSEPNRNPD